MWADSEEGAGGGGLAPLAAFQQTGRDALEEVWGGGG